MNESLSMFEKYLHPKDGVTDNLDRIINLNPHYSDPNFRSEQVIFGGCEEGLHYVYDDRLWQWDYNKSEAAMSIANQKAQRSTARWVQEYLIAYFDRPLEVKLIVAGVNQSSGYACWAAGYRLLTKKPEAETQNNPVESVDASPVLDQEFGDYAIKELEKLTKDSDRGGMND